MEEEEEEPQFYKCKTKPHIHNHTERDNPPYTSPPHRRQPPRWWGLAPQKLLHVRGTSRYVGS